MGRVDGSFGIVIGRTSLEGSGLGQQAPMRRYDLVTYCKQYGGFDRSLPRLLAITTL